MWFSKNPLRGGLAPAIAGEAWFNASGLPAAATATASHHAEIVPSQHLKGYVTLLHFWDYDCIHCLHTLPQLRDWWRKWRDHRFLLIGVHTPEFEFAKDADKVESAVLRFDLTYPVVSDPNYVTWQRYRVKAWPHVVVIDSSGVVRHEQSGAGHYDVIEKHIRQLQQLP